MGLVKVVIIMDREMWERSSAKSGASNNRECDFDDLIRLSLCSLNLFIAPFQTYDD